MTDIQSESNVNQTLQEQFRTFQVLLHRIYGPKHRGFRHGNPYRGQGRVLLLLGMQDSIRQKDLAFLLDIRPQSLGELLGKMEANELIVREVSEEDKRIMLVSLTEAGKEMAKKMEKEKEGKSVWLDSLDDTEKETLSTLFQKMIDSMNETVQTEEFIEQDNDPRNKHHGPGRGPHHHPHSEFPHHPHMCREHHFDEWR